MNISTMMNILDSAIEIKRTNETRGENNLVCFLQNV